MNDTVHPLPQPSNDAFQLVAPYTPAGDQPQAIAQLIDGFESGLAQQTLLGVTGSGKTYTIANVIQAVQKPTLVMAPNKTLAAQLYGEFKAFFPHNAVEYFVSYYDYYQPEAYVPSSDTFIEKDSLDQRAHRADAAVGDQGAAGAARRDHRLHGVGDLRPRRSRTSTSAWCLHMVARRAHRPARADPPPDRAAVHAQRHRAAPRHATACAARSSTCIPAEADAEALRIELFDGEIESLSHVRSADRRGAAQAAALHDLSEDRTTSPRANACSTRSRRSRSSCKERLE